jgi:hypothetical protein
MDRFVAGDNNTKEVAVIEEGVAVAVVSRLHVGWHEPIQECRVVVQDFELYF